MRVLANEAAESSCLGKGRTCTVRRRHSGGWGFYGKVIKMKNADNHEHEGWELVASLLSYVGVLVSSFILNLVCKERIRFQRDLDEKAGTITFVEPIGTQSDFYILNPIQKSKQASKWFDNRQQNPRLCFTCSSFNAMLVCPLSPSAFIATVKGRPSLTRP